MGGKGQPWWAVDVRGVGSVVRFGWVGGRERMVGTVGCLRVDIGLGLGGAGTGTGAFWVGVGYGLGWV